MKPRLFALIFVFVIWSAVTFTANASDPVAGAAPETVAAAANREIVPPKGRKKLVEWLKAGTYKKRFIAEPEVHPSTGPHGGNVRTFYNPILAENIRAGMREWKTGAAMVKELYLNGREKVIGFSVMIKTADESGPRAENWVFYESFNFNDPNSSAFYGRGLGLCANCHRAGTDYLLSPFRPTSVLPTQ